MHEKLRGNLPGDAHQLVGGSSIIGGEVHAVERIAALIGGKVRQERIESLVLAGGKLRNNFGVVLNLINDESDLVAGLLKLRKLGHNSIVNSYTGISHFVKLKCVLERQEGSKDLSVN